MEKYILQKNKGYTLLFSVLISSLLLAIGLAILTISKKELLLSSAGRESQFAFYAADTGVECALYWDWGGGRGLPKDGSTIKCNGQNSIPVALTAVAPPYPPYSPPIQRVMRYTFNISLDPANATPEPCALVTVDKRYTSNDDSQLVQRVVEARGHNTCVIDDPRRVERGLRVTY